MVEGPRPHLPEHHENQGLANATREISALIKANHEVDTRINGYIGHNALTKRSEQWIDTARRHPDYLDTALDLLDAVQYPTSIKGLPPKSVTEQIDGYFLKIQDRNARKLMTDILYGHVTRDALFSKSKFDESKDVLTYKAADIIQDLTTKNIGGGDRIEQIRNISLDAVVSAVLTRKVKLPRPQS